MLERRTVGLTWLALLSGAWLPPAVAAQQPEEIVPDSLPLFLAHGTVHVTLIADLETIFKDRRQESEEFPARIVVPTLDGGMDTLDIEVRTRGKLRLERRICGFPPVRLDFPTKASAHTIFAGQDKLKLVTHCQTGRAQYEQYVLQEYLAYRVFNLITDLSFRVRLARFTYVDARGKDQPITRYAFFIESDQHMATRNGWEALAIPMVPPAEVPADYMSLVNLFQYMVGNPDWSAFVAEPDKGECCHNMQPVGTTAGPVFSVPYDLDVTGAVNVPYAKPAPELGIRSLKDRVYRGLCITNETLPDAVQLFNARKDAIRALYEGTEELEPKERQRALEYYDEFYETINDARKFDREIVRRCRTR
jgi:hypothetical protein